MKNEVSGTEGGRLLTGGGGGAIKAEYVCWSVFPGVRSGLGFQEEMVYTACPQGVEPCTARALCEK